MAKDKGIPFKVALQDEPTVVQGGYINIEGIRYRVTVIQYIKRQPWGIVEVGGWAKGVKQS